MPSATYFSCLATRKGLPQPPPLGTARLCPYTPRFRRRGAACRARRQKKGAPQTPGRLRPRHLTLSGINSPRQEGQILTTRSRSLRIQPLGGEMGWLHRSRTPRPRWHRAIHFASSKTVHESASSKIRAHYFNPQHLTMNLYKGGTEGDFRVHHDRIMTDACLESGCARLVWAPGCDYIREFVS